MEGERERRGKGDTEGERETERERERVSEDEEAPKESLYHAMPVHSSSATSDLHLSRA